VENETNENQAPGNSHKIHGLESREVQRRVRNDVSLSESDYNVLLGVAERMEPGIYVSVLGNTAYLEERLIELFEQF